MRLQQSIHVIHVSVLYVYEVNLYRIIILALYLYECTNLSVSLSKTAIFLRLCPPPSPVTDIMSLTNWSSYITSHMFVMIATVTETSQFTLQRRYWTQNNTWKHWAAEETPIFYIALTLRTAERLEFRVDWTLLFNCSSLDVPFDILLFRRVVDRFTAVI
jgi:hypothetical protein